MAVRDSAVAGSVDFPTLAERVEEGFLQEAKRLIGGSVYIEKSVHVSSNGSHPEYPILAFRIEDNHHSGTSVTARIPIGFADESKQIYPAQVQVSGRPAVDYVVFRSPSDIGQRAAEEFRRSYTSAVMGL